MKIGIDLHKTITSDPEMFVDLMRSLKSSHEIAIVSGPSKGQIIAELEELDIGTLYYNSIISVVDFLLSCGHPFKTDDNGNYHFDNIVWWQSKALICAAHDIDLMIDDKEEYGKYFIGKCRFLLLKPSGLGCP